MKNVDLSIIHMKRFRAYASEELIEIREHNINLKRMIEDTVTLD